MLLSIDLPLKRATLHNEFCPSVPRPLDTKLKPVGTIGPEGAWFAVVDEVQAARLGCRAPAASHDAALPEVLGPGWPGQTPPLLPPNLIQARTQGIVS
jgi:hypothetical protein